jgi:two-component sensor histidine kinase
MSEPKKAVQLATLLAVLLAPYSETGATGERVQISVPDVLVGESSCTTIALIVHELATNAVKYGALSSEAGTVSITCAASETAVVLTWRELGGPVVPAPSRPSGFGSQLIRTSIAGNLGGTIDYEWPAEGAIITLCLSLARLGA